MSSLFISTRVNFFLLIIICCAAFSIAYPTIAYNVNNPNLIVYFDADEGYQMDLLWQYYSGEKRPTYQLTLDYGLELVYLADLSRLVLSKFIDLKPGTLVLIARWLHLLSWIGALIATWYIVGYHFGKGWQALATVSLLAVRPAFDHILNSMKPESLVLLIVIIGLHFALKLVDNPFNKKYILIAAAAAALAFIIKFAGAFILPAIVAALYFGYRCNNSSAGEDLSSNFWFKNSWIFPALVSIPIIISPLAAIFFYVRRSNGFTYYQEFGFLRSILKYKITFLFWGIGALLLFLSLALFLIRDRKTFFNRIKKDIFILNYYSMIVIGAFSLFVAIFGFRWFFIPEHFLEVYAVTTLDFTGGEMITTIHTSAQLLKKFFESLFYRLKAFDIWLAPLIALYFIFELTGVLKRADASISRYYKRLVLALYMAPCILSIFSIGRFSRHNMLPFFVSIAVLSTQTAFNIGKAAFAKRRILRNLAVLSVVLLLMADISLNAKELVEKRLRRIYQDEDIAFEIAKWWRGSIGVDTKIISDNYTLVYIPEEYKNVWTFRYSEDNTKAVEDLLRQVKLHNPRFIYINEKPTGMTPFPDLKKTPLGDNRIKVAKVFDNRGRNYQRWPDTRFIIYELSDYKIGGK